MSEEIRRLDRIAVRQLAEEHMKELREIATTGGNPYQTSLDQSDRVNQIASSMEETDATAFLNMYAEELNACTLKTNDETNQILAEAAAKNQSAEVVGGVIGLIVLFIVLFSIIN